MPCILYYYTCLIALTLELTRHNSTSGPLHGFRFLLGPVFSSVGCMAHFSFLLDFQLNTIFSVGFCQLHSLKLQCLPQPLLTLYPLSLLYVFLIIYVSPYILHNISSVALCFTNLSCLVCVSSHQNANSMRTEISFCFALECVPYSQNNMVHSRCLINICSIHSCMNKYFLPI